MSDLSTLANYWKAVNTLDTDLLQQILRAPVDLEAVNLDGLTALEKLVMAPPSHLEVNRGAKDYAADRSQIIGLLLGAGAHLDKTHHGHPLLQHGIDLHLADFVGHDTNALVTCVHQLDLWLTRARQDLPQPQWEAAVAASWGETLKDVAIADTWDDDIRNFDMAQEVIRLTVAHGGGLDSFLTVDTGNYDKTRFPMLVAWARQQHTLTDGPSRGRRRRLTS